MKNANPVSRWGGVLLALLALGPVSGCGRDGAGAGVEAHVAVPKTVADWFAIGVGGKTVQMQLAVLEPEMEHGLMGRTDLKDDQGMLFVYPFGQEMSFWMRNTPTPLDIGFFTGDGLLREVRQMYPYDETPVKSHRNDIQYCLEMKQGDFQANGLKVGDKLDLKALTDGLKARGFKPDLYVKAE